VFSFLVAGISALLSSLCYSEFAVCFPISGGAFNYILATLGEYAAWLTVATLVRKWGGVFAVFFYVCV
jgi:APA family basic amino acid/polyamine antiporter